MPGAGPAPAWSGNFWVSGDFQGLDSPRKNFKNESDEFYSGREKERVRVQCCCERSKRVRVDMGQLTSELHTWSVLGFYVFPSCRGGGGCLQDLWHQILTPPYDWERVLFLIWSILEASCQELPACIFLVRDLYNSLLGKKVLQEELKLLIISNFFPWQLKKLKSQGQKQGDDGS